MNSFRKLSQIVRNWWNETPATDIFLQSIIVVTLLSGIVITIFFFAVISRYFNIGAEGEELAMAETGQIGDFIGGIVGTIWTLTSIVLLYITFNNTKKQTQIALRSAAIQQLENTVFNQISVYNDIVKEIEVDWPFDEDFPNPIKGRTFFSKVAIKIHEIHELKTSILDKLRRNDPDSDLYDLYGEIMGGPIDKKDKIFLFFYSYYRSSFSHYFRFLYNAFKYIIEYDGFNGQLTSSEIRILKLRNLNFLKAQLSTYELILLCYNGEQQFGRKFGAMLLDWQLLDNIDLSAEIADMERLIDIHEYLDE